MSYSDTMNFLRTGTSNGTGTGYSGMVGGSDAPPFLCDALCTMRASYLIYRNAHWQVSGGNFYALHLLFERLYNESKDIIDTLAEQIVASYGSDGIREDAQVIAEQVMVFSQPQHPVEKGLLAAATVRDKLAHAFQALRANGTPPLGWDAVLTEVASVNDKHMYLLQQQAAGG